MTEKLYILIRKDLDSMNNCIGKAMAQVAHAANQFLFYYGENEIVQNWMLQTEDGFGTTIVLGATDYNDFERDVQNLIDNDAIAGFVVDPSYKIKDGNYEHSVSVVSAAFIFSSDDNSMCANVAKRYELY